MKLITNSIFTSRSIEELARQLTDLFRKTNDQVNQLAEGRMSAMYGALLAPPASGMYAVGDFVPNANRGVILGTAGGQYLLWGWTCTVASTESTPASWAQTRMLTGT